MSFFLVLTKIGSLDLRVAPGNYKGARVTYISLLSQKSQVNNY